MGFGARIFHGNPGVSTPFYGEWEVGTYYAGWRIVRDGRVLCGSDDVVDSIAEHSARVDEIGLGAVTSIQMLSAFDVRLNLENSCSLDFLGTHGEIDEEVVHIFGPDDLYLEFLPGEGWKIGPAGRDWRISDSGAIR